MRSKSAGFPRAVTPVAPSTCVWTWPGWNNYRIPLSLGRPSPTPGHARSRRDRLCRVPTQLSGGSAAYPFLGHHQEVPSFRCVPRNAPGPAQPGIRLLGPAGATATSRWSSRAARPVSRPRPRGLDTVAAQPTRPAATVAAFPLPRSAERGQHSGRELSDTDAILNLEHQPSPGRFPCPLSRFPPHWRP